MASTASEPIRITWATGVVSIGYLGGRRYRVVIADSAIEVAGARAAIDAVLDEIVRGVVTSAAAERAPIRLSLSDDTIDLVADPRLRDGWTWSSVNARSDLGDRAALAERLASWLASRAECAWARGVEPVRPPPLGHELSFHAFATARDPKSLCAALADHVTRRMRESACPTTSFLASVRELQTMGHDLWSWDVDEVWGHDYMTARPGAGLRITRLRGDDGPTDEVVVEYTPPSRSPK